jgi:hypothetical protein
VIQVKQIDILPYDALLGIFDFYMDVYAPFAKTDAEAWQLLVHVYQRWRSPFSITTSPESATFLYTPNMRKRDTGRLASLASHRCGLYGLIIKDGQRRCSTCAEQSHMSSLPLGHCELATWKSLGRDAGVIPRADSNPALVT